MRWKSLLAISFFAVGCGQAQSADWVVTAACAWGPRDSIRLKGGYAYLESPRAAVHGKEVTLISTQSIERNLRGQVMLQSPTSILLAGLRLGDSARGEPIDLPPGVAKLHRPRIAALPDGRVEVVWQGGVTAPDDTLVARLWTSTLDRGVWSKARIIGDWRIPDIGITASSDLVALGDDLGFAVAGFGDSTFLYTRTSGVWHRQSLTGSSTYVALARAGSGFMAAIVSEGLTVLKVGAGGPAKPPALVASGDNFHYPVLMPTPTGAILAWVSGVGGDSSIVRVARSSDGGDNWEEARPFAAEGGLQSFDAFVNDSGVVYVAGRGSSDDGPWPFAAALYNGEWRPLPIPRLRNELGIVPPRFSRRPGPAELLWGLIMEKGLESEAPMLARVRARTDCIP